MSNCNPTAGCPKCNHDPRDCAQRVDIEASMNEVCLNCNRHESFCRCDEIGWNRSWLVKPTW